MNDVCRICVFRENLDNAAGAIKKSFKQRKKSDTNPGAQKRFFEIPEEESGLAVCAVQLDDSDQKDAHAGHKPEDVTGCGDGL